MEYNIIGGIDMDDKWTYIDYTNLDAKVRKREANIKVQLKYDEILILAGQPDKAGPHMITNANLHILSHDVFKYTDKVMIGNVYETADNVIARGFSIRHLDTLIILHIDSGYCRVVVLAR